MWSTYARASKADTDRAITAAKSRPGVGALQHPRALRDPEEGVGRDPGAQGGTRTSTVARDGEDARKDGAEGIGEAARAGQIFAFFAGEAVRWVGGRARELGPTQRRSRRTREPMGVVGLITPWNFPIAIPAWKIAPALASATAWCSSRPTWRPARPWALADILNRAGLPRACSTW